MTTALEVHRGEALAAPVVGGAPMPTPPEWDMLQSMAGAIHRSKMFSQYSSTEQVMVAMLVGRDLGLAPTAALSKGFIIEDGGRFKFDVEVQVKLAVVQARIPDFLFEIVEWTPEVCHLRGGIKGRQQVESKVTLQEAKDRRWAVNTKGETKKTYQNNSKDMLMWRAGARLLKLTAGAALYGFPPILRDAVEDEDGAARFERSSAAVVEDDVPAGNGVGASEGAAPSAPVAAPQDEWREWWKKFIARAKKCGWTTAAKQRDLVNNGMRELGLSEVQRPEDVGPHGWKPLFEWLDGRYNEDGQPRPKKSAEPVAPEPAAVAPVQAQPSGDDGFEIPEATREEEPAAEPEVDHAQAREGLLLLATQVQAEYAQANRKRVFLLESPPASGNVFLTDLETLRAVGSTKDGTPIPVLITTKNEAAVARLCSDAMVEQLTEKLRDARRAIGR